LYKSVNRARAPEIIRSSCSTSDPCRATVKLLPVKYHPVGIVPKYHPVGIVPKYHPVGIVPKYHPVGIVAKSNCKFVERTNKHSLDLK
jgi:hypothetical protein